MTNADTATLPVENTVVEQKEIKRYTMIDPVELATLKTQVAYLRDVLQAISMMSEEAVLEEPDRAQRIACEALYTTKSKETP